MCVFQSFAMALYRYISLTCDSYNFRLTMLPKPPISLIILPVESSSKLGLLGSWPNASKMKAHKLGLALVLFYSLYNQTEEAGN